MPLLRALGDSRPEFRSNDLARDFAAAFLGEWQPLDLPFLVDRQEVREALLRGRALRPAVSLWERLDLAIVGIGSSIARSPLLCTPHFDKADIMEMERLGIVGDVLSRFFDARGAIPPLPFCSRLIGIDLSLLRPGPLVVGVAGGLEKTTSILGALRGRFVDLLVTDERTARAILKQPEAPSVASSAREAAAYAPRAGEVGAASHRPPAGSHRCFGLSETEQKGAWPVLRAACLVGRERIELQQRPVPEPGPGEVRVRPVAVGVCGSDMHAFLGEHPFVHPPIVLGHEVGAVVDEVGPGVGGLQVGQRVTIEPNLVCGRCYNCRNGRYNICERLRVIGCVGYDGAMAEYLVVPAGKIVPVPASWPVERAALVEPTAVGVHAVRQGLLQPGQDVLVLGAGIIGLVTAQAARALGASRVLIADPIDARLERARSLGLPETLNNERIDLRQAVRERFGEKGADLIFDCVGIQPTLDAAVEAARKGTRIVMVGVPAGRLSVDMALVQDRELEIVGTLMYRKEDYQTAIELMDREAIKVDPLVTHRFPLDRVMEAFDVAVHQKKDALKVMILGQ